MGRRSSLDDITYALVIGGLAALALIILVGPVIVVLAVSLTSDRSLRFPPSGLSFQYYRALFDAGLSGQIHKAALNSLRVAAVTTLGAAILGTLAAVGIARSKARLARAADGFFMSPLLLPGIAFGLAALVYFSLLELRPSLELIMLGHTVVIVPFVLRTASASLSQLDGALLESSASLGASAFRTFRRITLPVIFPGIAAGSFLAFIASMDNVPVSLFLQGPRSDMLPIRLWGMMESTLDVRVAAVSGVTIVLVLVLMLLMERFSGLTRRMRG
jgi:putative spermidine/putrescine transport system permease protein